MAHTPRSALDSRLSRSFTRQLQPGGLLWALTVVFFLAQVVAQLAWPSYSLLDNRVSDLGNTECGLWMGTISVCSPWHAVFNASMVLAGVAIALGVYFNRAAWPPRRLTTWGLGFLAVTGLCTIVVGLAPENVSLRLHLVGALNIPCSQIAMLLLGLAAWNTRRWVAWLSIGLAVIGFLGLPVGLALMYLTSHGNGLAERLALYPIFVWTVTIGVWLIRSAVAADRDADFRLVSALPWRTGPHPNSG